MRWCDFVADAGQCAGYPLLQEKGVPFVTIGSYDDNTLYQIDVDQRGGCKELTMRLLQQGVRNIALFAQPYTCRHPEPLAWIFTGV